MYRRVFPPVALVVLAIAPIATGQSAMDYGRHYQRLREATARLDAHFDSASKRRIVPGSVDTIRAGALIVYTAPELRARARIATDSAWLLVTRIFGSRAALAGGTPLLLESSERRDSASLEDLVNGVLVELPPGTPAEQVRRGVLDVIGPAIYGHADAELKRWLPWIYSDTILRLNVETLYEELATSPWSASRRCFDGSLVACRLALGITPVDPITGWYDAADRRNYVAHVLPLPITAITAARECVRDGDDQACIASLKRAPGGAPEPPLGAQARQLLVALAINTGGPDAYDRLLEHAGQPLEIRISAAAVVPIDTLVYRWRTRIISAHPQTVAADARAAWAAVAWGVLLMVIALRSTRWR